MNEDAHVHVRLKWMIIMKSYKTILNQSNEEFSRFKGSIMQIGSIALTFNILKKGKGFADILNISNGNRSKNVNETLDGYWWSVGKSAYDAVTQFLCQFFFYFLFSSSKLLITFAEFLKLMIQIRTDGKWQRSYERVPPTLLRINRSCSSVSSFFKAHLKVTWFEL